MTAHQRAPRLRRIWCVAKSVWRVAPITRVAQVSALLCLVAVAEFTWEVFVDDDVIELDEQITNSVLEVRGERVTSVMRTITALANTETIAAVTVACLGVALARRCRRQALGVMSAVLGTSLIVFALKELLARERPSPPYNLTDLAINAYPSGHAAHAVATWGAAAWLLTTGGPRWIRVLSGLVAGNLAVVIGVSRVYLGVHWSSDVVAGWAVGGLCLSAGILVGSRRIEPFEAEAGHRDDTTPTAATTSATTD